MHAEPAGNAAGCAAAEAPGLSPQMMLEYQLPPEVAAILDADFRTDDPFGAGDFDPVEHLNQCFATEEAASRRCGAFLDGLDAKIAVCEVELGDAVCTQAAARGDADRSLREAGLTVRELFGRMGEMRRAAERSERMVSEVCAEISELDAARQSLRWAVDTLTAARVLGEELDATHAAARDNNLRRAAVHLETARKLVDGPLSEHLRQQRVSDLVQRLELLRRECEQQALRQLRAAAAHIGDGAPASPPAASAPPPDPAAACELVTAAGGSSREAAVAALVQLLLHHYKEAFGPGTAEGAVARTERRFAWLRRQLRAYEQSPLSRAVPPDWGVPQELCVEFCLVTRSHIEQQLSDPQKPVHVEIMVRVLQKAIDFERDIAARMLQGVEGLRKDYRFQGFITSCFERHMGAYVEHEDAQMAALVAGLKLVEREGAASPVPDGADRTLPAAADLFFFIKESLRRCAALARDETLYAMHGVWTRNLVAFANRLADGVPTHGSLEGHSTACVIINTADWCQDTATRLAEEVQAKLSDMEEKRPLSDAAPDAMRSTFNRAVGQLLGDTDKMLRPALDAMRQVSWGQFREVGDSSGYITSMCAVLHERFTLYGRILLPGLLRYVCDKFVSSFVPRYTATLYELGEINGPGCQQLLLDLQVLKALLSGMPNLGTEPGEERFTRKELRGYLRSVAREVGRGEGMLKFLQLDAPGDDRSTVLVDMYVALSTGPDASLPEPSLEHFRRLLEIRGASEREKRAQLEHLQRMLCLPPSQDVLAAAPDAAAAPGGGAASRASDLREAAGRRAREWRTGLAKLAQRKHHDAGPAPAAPAAPGRH